MIKKNVIWDFISRFCCFVPGGSVILCSDVRKLYPETSINFITTEIIVLISWKKKNVYKRRSGSLVVSGITSVRNAFFFSVSPVRSRTGSALGLITKNSLVGAFRGLGAGVRRPWARLLVSNAIISNPFLR